MALFILDTNVTCRGYFMRVSFSFPSLNHCCRPKQVEYRDSKWCHQETRVSFSLQSTSLQVCSPSWQQEGSSQSQGNYELVTGSWSGERKFLSKPQQIGSMNCFWWDDHCYLSPNQSLWRGTVANHWLVGSEAVPCLNGGEGRRLDELHGVSVWVWRDTLKTVSASMGRNR